jgi:hypothetical protein
MKESDRYCPHCKRETYFNGNTCRCCHFNFSEWELAHNSLIHPMVKPAEYLCDSCVYDWRASCQVPERPTVKLCSKYKKSECQQHNYERTDFSITEQF